MIFFMIKNYLNKEQEQERLLIFEKKIEGKKMKNDRNALFDEKIN